MTDRNTDKDSQRSVNVEDDEVSSLGDASPMNQAEARKKSRQQRVILRIALFSGVALFSLLGSVSNQRLDDYKNAAKDPATSHALHQLAGQNKTILAQFRKDLIDRMAEPISRPFQPVSPSVWCIDSRLKYEQSKRRPMGLCYLKIPRAASSTLSGINQRIARNFAKRNGLKKTCIRHDGNIAGPYYQFRDGLSFLWTLVRDPTSRAMSRIGHSIKKQRGKLHNIVPLEDYTSTILESLKTSDDVQYGAISAGRGGFQVQYAMLQIIEEGAAYNRSNPGQVVEPINVKRRVASIINGYNFIGVVERFDESLVALQLLLGLETSDILYFAVKQKEQYQIAGGRGPKFCQKPLNWNKLMTKQIRDHIESDEWFAQNYGDYILHEAAKISLDKTIVNLGLKEFSQALKDFRALLKRALEECHPILPCSSNGTVQYEDSLKDCIADSTTCGYKCLDSLTAKGEE